jgi:hypothetical protein
MLNLSEWHHDWYVRNRKNNLMWREVNAQRAKDWRKANPERVREYRQEWRAANAEHVKKRQRLRRLRKRVERKLAA